MQQARVKNWLGKGEGNKNKLMWLCHKELTSSSGWTEIKNIFCHFSLAHCGSTGAVEGLNKARETTLLSILAHWVVSLA